MHTGYAKTAYGEANKMERNIKMLRDELERTPNDPHLMLYLADSIKAAGTEEARVEAEGYYIKALEIGKKADPAIKRLAYDFLIPRFTLSNEKKTQAMQLCNMAIEELPNHIDYYYFRAVLNNQNSEYATAMDDLTKCEAALTAETGTPDSRAVIQNPVLLFNQLFISAKGLGDEQDIVKYETITQALLTDSKAKPEVLRLYMIALLQQAYSAIEVIEQLSQVYDMNDPKELLFIARAAKDCGALQLAGEVMKIASEVMGKQ
jgi:tetratricopeptide (TPR) repeat protein